MTIAELFAAKIANQDKIIAIMESRLDREWKLQNEGDSDMANVEECQLALYLAQDSKYDVQIERMKLCGEAK